MRLPCLAWWHHTTLLMGATKGLVHLGAQVTKFNVLCFDNMTRAAATPISFPLKIRSKDLFAHRNAYLRYRFFLIGTLISLTTAWLLTSVLRSRATCDSSFPRKPSCTSQLLRSRITTCQSRRKCRALTGPKMKASKVTQLSRRVIAT